MFLMPNCEYLACNFKYLSLTLWLRCLTSYIHISIFIYISEARHLRHNWIIYTVDKSKLWRCARNATLWLVTRERKVVTVWACCTIHSVRCAVHSTELLTWRKTTGVLTFFQTIPSFLRIFFTGVLLPVTFIYLVFSRRPKNTSHDFCDIGYVIHL
jgi:hypothetical protein